MLKVESQSAPASIRLFVCVHACLCPLQVSSKHCCLCQCADSADTFRGFVTALFAVKDHNNINDACENW